MAPRPRKDKEQSRIKRIGDTQRSLWEGEIKYISPVNWGWVGLRIRKIRYGRKGENPGRYDWNWGNGHFGETWKPRAVETPRNLQE